MAARVRRAGGADEPRAYGSGAGSRVAVSVRGEFGERTDPSGPHGRCCAAGSKVADSTLERSPIMFLRYVQCARRSSSTRPVTASACALTCAVDRMVAAAQQDVDEGLYVEMSQSDQERAIWTRGSWTGISPIGPAEELDQFQQPRRTGVDRVSGPGRHDMPTAGTGTSPATRRACTPTADRSRSISNPIARGSDRACRTGAGTPGYGPQGLRPQGNTDAPFGVRTDAASSVRWCRPARLPRRRRSGALMWR